MSLNRTIKVLEAAQEHRKCHPALMLGYAVGLTALDRSSAKLYAGLLEGYDSLKQYPGGEISEETYDIIRTRYVVTCGDLRNLLGHDLDVNDPNTLSRAIEELRQLAAN